MVPAKPETRSSLRSAGKPRNPVENFGSQLHDQRLGVRVVTYCAKRHKSKKPAMVLGSRRVSGPETQQI